MADNNMFSVRLEEQDKEKLLQMMQESGRSNKEFMGVLLSAYELNKAKIEIPDLAKDIEGLQALTQRINDYYVNIGKRIEDTQKSKDLQYTKEIYLYKNRIDVLKAENEKLNADFEALQQTYNSTCGNIEEYKKQLEQLVQIQESNKALIKEYQSKIDTLSGIIEEYKGYKAEIETIKSLLTDTNTKVLQQDNIIKNKELDINKLNADIKTKENDINDLKLKNDEAVKRITDKHLQELEQLKKENELNVKLAVAEIKEELNNKLLLEQQKHNKEIEEYQAKYKALLEEMELNKNIKPTPNKQTMPKTK